MNVVLLLLAGLVVLIAGAELLVRGASRLAMAVGLSRLVIGLTVVAYGTSTPELSVSVLAALRGSSDIALGNVVGSNIFNVLAILGIAALVAPLRVSAQLVRVDVPLMIAVSVALPLLALDGRIGRFDGILLFGAALLYSVLLVRQGLRQGNASPDDAAGAGGRPGSRVGSTLLVLAGLTLLVLGAKWLVDSATFLARSMGVSDLVIGLTIVAAGTSLPEAATSVMASIRGERDIAVGNIVGSNLFNILAILGITALVQEINMAPAALRFDIPVMIAVAVACLPVFFTGGTIGRWEGLTFLLYYAAYVLYLFLSSTGHDALPAYSRVMVLFVVPITFLTLSLTAWHYARRPRQPGG